MSHVHDPESAYFSVLQERATPLTQGREDRGRKRSDEGRGRRRGGREEGQEGEEAGEERQREGVMGKSGKRLEVRKKIVGP